MEDIINKKITFPKNNKIEFCQDFSVKKGIPSDVEFTIESKLKNVSRNEYWLIGDGYGKDGNYGNGTILVKYEDIISIIKDKKLPDFEYEIDPPINITKDTKIGELIPEGWEFEYSNGEPNGSDYKAQIHLHIKKKEEKNFEWYYKQYLSRENYLDNNVGNNILGFLVNKNYDDIVFEFKIGLLKFICDDINYSLWWFDLVQIKKKLDGEQNDNLSIINTIYDICPKEFLESIFK